MIVDDSAVARAVLSRMVAAHADFEIVATAGNASEALDALEDGPRRHHPARRRDARRERPRGAARHHPAGRGARVLIVSSMAEDGAETTVRALALGAADTLPKPGIGNFAGRFAEVLADRLRRIGRAERATGPAAPAAATAAAPAARHGRRAARLRRARRLDRRPATPCSNSSAPLPTKIGAPILVTQHLPAIFMPHFARQLEAASGRNARVAEDGELARGRRHPCRARRRPSLRRARRRTACGSGSTASARRAAACPRSIRCSPRSPTPTARPASA